MQINFLAAAKTGCLSLVRLHPFSVVLPAWFSWGPTAFFALPPALSFELLAGLLTVLATICSCFSGFQVIFFSQVFDFTFPNLACWFKGALSFSWFHYFSFTRRYHTGAEKKAIHSVNSFWTNGPIIVKLGSYLIRTSKMHERHLWKSEMLSELAGCWHAILPKMTLFSRCSSCILLVQIN